MSAFTLGVVCGILAAVIAPRLWRHRPRRAVREKPRTYGHPEAPVPWLRDHLPNAPQGHFWEIRTEPAGTDIRLHLALIAATTGQPVAATDRSLINAEFRTYAEDYRKYSLLRGETFRNKLMGPFLDWATKQAIKHNPSTDGEYEVSR